MSKRSQTTNDFVELQFRRLGIEFDTFPDEHPDISNSATNHLGKLGDLKIGWRRGYWTVEGSVPIDTARWIFAADVERVIRAAGHCMAPSPDDWCKWYDSDGSMLFVDPGGVERAKIAASPSMSAIDWSSYRFVESLDEVPDRRGVIDCYHIDTNEGFARFVAIMRHAIGAVK